MFHRSLVHHTCVHANLHPCNNALVQDNDLGLRERQRLQTLQTLRTAAVDLVRDRGLNEITVAEIADRAGVSRRTFFNYYACKEDAVLGAGPPSVPEEPLDEFLRTPPGQARLDKAIALILAVAASTRRVGERHADHAELVARHPELTDRVHHLGVTALELLAAAITDHLADAPPEQVNDTRAVVMLAGTVLRFAYRTDPDVYDNPDSPALADARAVFRRTIKELI